MSKNNLKDLEAYLALLTPRIQTDIEKWYGSKAKLIGAPSFHARNWSFFTRYLIQVSENEEKAILVKIRHLENMNIPEAITDTNMREEIKNEFQSLVRLRSLFSGQREFFTIRDLAHYADLNSFVMEEAEIRTLKSDFQAVKTWLRKDSYRQFLHHIYLTGRWLYTFHNQISQNYDGVVFDNKLYDTALENLQKINKFTNLPELKKVKDLIDDLFKIYNKRELQYGILHDNYTSANVFITKDGRICSFDPHNKLGPLYLDLAKFIIDLETNKLQILTNGIAISAERMEEIIVSFLDGYTVFGIENYNFINLYRLLMLIEKWKENEYILIEAAGLNKLLYSLGIVQMRYYFAKLLRNQIEKIQMSIPE